MKLPETIEIAGFTYQLLVSPATDRILRNEQNYGTCLPSAHSIQISSEYGPEQLTATFVHEVLHAIDDAYLGGQLTEAETHALSNGLYQALKQLGFRMECPDGQT